MSPNRLGYMPALCIALAAIAGSLTGLFRNSDAWFGDQVAALRPAQTPKREILLVESPQSLLADSNWSELANLVSNLADLGAKQIGILCDADPIQLEALSELPSANRIVIATNVSSSNSAEAGQRIHSASGIARGSIDLMLEQAIYREHQTSAVDRAGRRIASLESQLVRRLGRRSHPMPSGRFGIHFADGLNRLPKIDSRRVINGDAVSELVRDRVVLIGAVPRDEIGFLTPVTRQSPRMGRLELHGHVLNSLLTGTALTPASLWLSSVLVLVVALLSTQVFLNASLRHSVLAYLASLVVIFALSWTLWHFAYTKIPSTAMVFVVSLCAVQCLAFRFRVLRELVESWTLMRRSERLFDAPVEYQSDDAWQTMFEAAEQIFAPEKMVVFELKKNATHLSLARTYRCVEDQVIERRRDVTRSPFKEAIAAGEATPNVSERPILAQETEKASQPSSPDSAGEPSVEYLVPLLDASRCVGLIVVHMSRESIEDWDGFPTFLTNFASNVFGLAREQNAAAKTLNAKPSQFQLDTVPEELQKARLFAAERQHCLETNLLSQAFTHGVTPAVMCDAFGRVLKANRGMWKILAEIGSADGSTSCISILETLTQWDTEQCRRAFRRCSHDGLAQSASIAACPERSQDLRRPPKRMLHLSPLGEVPSERGFALRHVLIQVSEQSALEESSRWAEQFENHKRDSIAKSLRQLKSLATAAEHPTGDNDASGSGAQSHHTLETMLKTIEGCQELISESLDEQSQLRLSVCIDDAVSVALRRKREQISDGHLSSAVGATLVTPVMPESISTGLMVVGNPFQLDNILGLLVECVSSDAPLHSRVTLNVDRHEDRVVLQLRHQPMDATEPPACKTIVTNSEERDQSPCGAYQVEPAARSILSASHLERLGHMRPWLESWDATLSIRCGDDYRLWAKLDLLRADDASTSADGASARTLVANANCTLNESRGNG